jgi:hypothetical protein
MKDDILYITGKTTEGDLLVGGLFKFKDELGFPLDVSLDVIKDYPNTKVDWCEYLADAGRQLDWKFESVLDEIRLLLGENTEKIIIVSFMALGNRIMRDNSDLTFVEVCERIIDMKRKGLIKT